MQEKTRLAARGRIHGTQQKEIQALTYHVRKGKVTEESFMARKPKVEDQVLFWIKRKRRIFHKSNATDVINMDNMPESVMIQSKGSMKLQLHM